MVLVTTEVAKKCDNLLINIIRKQTTCTNFLHLSIASNVLGYNTTSWSNIMHVILHGGKNVHFELVLNPIKKDEKWYAYIHTYIHTILSNIKYQVSPPPSSKTLGTKTYPLCPLDQLQTLDSYKTLQLQ